MSFKVNAVEEKDFPITIVRASVYKNAINDFLASDLQRGSIDMSAISKSAKIIQTSLRRNAKGRNLQIDVSESKIAFFKKLD